MKENNIEGLVFNDKFDNMVKEGIKISTIRKHTDLKKGDIFHTYLGKDYYIITEVNRICFGEINRKIAYDEGYLHEDLLKCELEEIYNKGEEIEDSELFYQIKFKKYNKEVNKKCIF